MTLKRVSLVPTVATVVTIATRGVERPTHSRARRRVTERMFVELRDDALWSSLSDEELRTAIGEHLDGMGLK